MNKKNLLLVSVSAILLYGCGSKAENTAKEVKNLREQYIKDMDAAQTKEEALKIHKEFEERVEFESSKLSEEEIKEYEELMASTSFEVVVLTLSTSSLLHA